MAQKMLNTTNRKLVFVPALADYRAPKLTELNAVGVLELSCLVTAANYNLGSTGDDSIEDPAMCASGKSTVPGLTNYEAGMDFFRWKNTADDKAWTTFTGKGIGGFLVERIGQLADGEKAQNVPFKAGDEVRVYEVLTGTPAPLSPSTVGFEKFRVNFFVQDRVDERAKVTA